MKKLGIITSAIVITSVFIYSMFYLSIYNKCSGVRIYDCKKETNKKVVPAKLYSQLKIIGDIFLNDCKPKITEEKNNYLLDYSKCNVKVNIKKENMWVDSVEVNNKKLTNKQIKNNF